MLISIGDAELKNEYAKSETQIHKLAQERRLDSFLSPCPVQPKTRKFPSFLGQLIYAIFM